MWRYLIGGALAAFSMHGGAYAAPASLAADAARFGARENAAQVALSPSGNRVVMLVAGQGRSTIARVVDLQSGDIRDLIVSRATPEALDWCNFATDAQLVCQYGGNVDMTGQIVSFSRLVTVGADGKLIRPLGQSASAYDANIRQSDGKILDWLDEGGGHVLMQRNYVAETGRTGSNIVRKKDGLGVDKIDLSSLKVVQVESPNRVIANYMTDGRGQIRIRRIDEANTDGILNGVRNFSFRRLGSKQWEPLGSHDARDDSGLYPLAIEADSNSVFVLRKLNGRDALYRVSLDGMATTILVAKNPAVDIDGVTRFGRGQRVIGYTYADDRRRTVYFDTEFQKLASSLGRALPNAPILDFVSASADGSKLLVFAGSDTLPGTYYLLNRKTRELSPLADVRPPLADRPLSPVKSVFYTARDGASIPAYLTVPAGSDAKNLPAIVLPHGGPSARDEWGFDWLAQFLASRGYAVIQPNFRGSAGYGDDFENGNGFRNWRTSIADVGDAGRYLVKEGIADKGRMAVVGWSYGGYAALQVGAIEPDMFKSIVAIAPVTDLNLLKRQADGFTNSDLVKGFVGSGDNTRAGSPIRNASAIKAPVLLVHGDLDANVGIAHSVGMERALASTGKPVTLLRYKGLDHYLDDSTVRVEMLMKIGELLERTIGK